MRSDMYVYTNEFENLKSRSLHLNKQLGMKKTRVHLVTPADLGLWRLCAALREWVILALGRTSESLPPLLRERYSPVELRNFWGELHSLWLAVMTEFNELVYEEPADVK